MSCLRRVALSDMAQFTCFLLQALPFGIRPVVLLLALDLLRDLGHGLRGRQIRLLGGRPGQRIKSVRRYDSRHFGLFRQGLETLGVHG